MPGRLIPLITEEIYHVINRSISHQPVFVEKRDYDRCLEAMRYYQNIKPPIRYSRFLTLSNENRKNLLDNLEKKHEFLVEIIAYCFMPNHRHVLARQIDENGISKFMSNLTNSYTRYFNVKHKRKGPLFQGKFKAVRVETDEQLLHLSRYIHLNPFSSCLVKSAEQAISYSYSSFSEYLQTDGLHLCAKATVLALIHDTKP